MNCAHRIFKCAKNQVVRFASAQRAICMTGPACHVRGTLACSTVNQRLRSRRPIARKQGSIDNGNIAISSRRLLSDTAGQDGPGPEQGKQPLISTATKEAVLREWEQNIDMDYLVGDMLTLHNAHFKAVKEGKELYLDPFTSFEVFTMIAHLNRGYCCGNNCRHCPYKHASVEPKYRDLMNFNTSFYC